MVKNLKDNSQMIHPRNKPFSYATYLLIFIALMFLQMCTTSRKTTLQQPDRDGIEQKSVLEKIAQDSIEPALADTPGTKSAKKPVPDDVAELLKNMTLREKIGQLFFVRANGHFTSDDDENYRRLVNQINQHHIGGLIFFNGDVYGQAVLTNKLQQISQIPLWITQDMEYGAAMRINGTTRFTPAMGVAATQNPDYAYWVGKITAREAKAVGVHQIFAPVLDVNNNPDNPVINVRSFSGDPEIVSAFGNRFIEGVESEGLVATAKHFPGHGDTGTDSHISLPVIDYDYSRLDSVELVPFRSAIENGVQSIMSAHISFPKLSQNPDIPGTLDESILQRILSDSLNFNGMVVTDGLEMSGISSNFSPGNTVVRALQAGADMMLLSPDALTAINEVENAVQKGTISEDRIEQSVRKILSWKKEYGLFEQAKIDINKLSSVINTTTNRIFSDEISRRSLTLLRNRNDILPIREADYPNIAVISLADDESGQTGSSFVRQLRQYHPNVTSHVFDNRTGKEEREEMLRDAREADLIIIGSFIYVRSGQEVQLSDDQRSLLEDLPEKTPSALIAFGNPYVVSDLSDTDVQLLAWSANGNQVNNTVPALFGGTSIGGKLPISIPGMYKLGDGIEMPQSTLRYDEPETVGLSRDSLRKVDRIMNEAIFDSTFPGGVVAVVKDGVIAYQEGFGYHTYEKIQQVRSDDIYDLASLTKVLATTAAIMKLVDEGEISLDDKISKFIPEYRSGDKSSVTIRNFLLHNSGLPPFRVYVDSLTQREEILRAVKKEPLVNPPGEKYVYSDLGFILLADIVEQLTGKPFDRYLREQFYNPLGMRSTFFNPAQRGSWIQQRIPPTEIDTVFRNKTIQGEVHDERAYYLDGVAGHAGLFSNARDIAVFCQMIMNKGFYGVQEYLSATTVNEFIRKQQPESERGLGFDYKSEGFSSAGSLTSMATFGHLGFTGTSFWIDPEHDLGIIMLTNRTYPSREGGKNISKVRAAVADAIISSIISE